MVRLRILDILQEQGHQILALQANGSQLSEFQPDGNKRNILNQVRKS